MQALMIIAGVLAIGSLLITVLFVHDRRLRTSGLLLSGGLICMIFAPMFFDSRTAAIIGIVATIPIVISAAINLRSARARPD